MIKLKKHYKIIDNLLQLEKAVLELPTNKKFLFFKMKQKKI
jgi:hypothetical protein